jgi:hypothetical protein
MWGKTVTPGLRRLYVPHRVQVEVTSDGTPSAVESVRVEAVREEWLVEDSWWTGRPLKRHYYELVLADGRDVTVFLHMRNGRWYRQRA